MSDPLTMSEVYPDEVQLAKLSEDLDEFGSKITASWDVMNLARVQPEPFRSQLTGVATDLDNSQLLNRRAAAGLRARDRQAQADTVRIQSLHNFASRYRARVEELEAAIRAHRHSEVAEQAFGDPQEVEYSEWDITLWETVDPSGDI